MDKSDVIRAMNIQMHVMCVAIILLEQNWWRDTLEWTLEQTWNDRLKWILFGMDTSRICGYYTSENQQSEHCTEIYTHTLHRPYSIHLPSLNS